MSFWQRRLTRPSDYQRVYSTGRRLDHRYFRVYYAPAALASCYGIITSKRLGKAVVRNRSRRQFREIIHHYSDRFNTQYDFVFVVKHSFVSAPFWPKASEIESFLKRFKLLDGDEAA